MKWTKFDPSNPPSDAYTLWCFAIPANTAFAFGKYYEHLGLRCFHEDAVTSFFPNELTNYNAHYIYPQDLEMPE